MSTIERGVPKTPVLAVRRGNVPHVGRAAIPVVRLPVDWSRCAGAEAIAIDARQGVADLMDHRQHIVERSTSRRSDGRIETLVKEICAVVPGESRACKEGRYGQTQLSCGVS